MALTKAVVANFVLSSPTVGVGHVGVPVKVGEAKLAFRAKSAPTSCSAVSTFVPV